MTRRFQRLSYYTLALTSRQNCRVVNARIAFHGSSDAALVKEALTSGHFILIRYAIMFDIEKFICEVEQRPAIYDVTSKEYSNKQIKGKCWNDVGEAMYEDWHCMTSEEKDHCSENITNGLYKTPRFQRPF